MIDVIKLYICTVIDVPERNCPHFKACLKNGKKGKCLLTKEEMKKQRKRIIGYRKKIMEK